MAAYFDSPAPLLPEIIALHGKWRASKPAVIFERDEISWGEFTARIARVANGLVQAGCQPTDRIAVLMSNSIEMVEALFGIMAAGCVSVPINLSVTDKAMLGMLEDSGSSALFVSGDQQRRLQSDDHLLPEKIQLVVTTGRLDEASELNACWQQYHSFFTEQSADQSAEQSSQNPAVEIRGDDYLNIIYSSGTTGLPKGIVHTASSD